MRSHLERSAFDVLAQIAVPVCIMGLVGSVVYFLIDLRSLYFPGGSGLLKYVFFFYIIGTVLINRIRAMLGLETSAAYSVFLGAAVLLFLFVFSRSIGPITGGRVAEGPAMAINVLVMALIWFMCDRLTKSCHIDEDDDTMAEGLVSGVAARRRTKTPPADTEQADFKETMPRKHPGMAVVYFSCMSLVFFGAGLKLIPAEETWVRIKTFWCMVMYVFCAFSLLMLTSFSGFRHYFRKRKMAVPARIAAFWLGFGWVVAVVVLILADILPQPAGGGPRLRTEVPAIGRTVQIGARFTKSLIDGFASPDRVEEQKGWAKDAGEKADEGQVRRDQRAAQPGETAQDAASPPQRSPITRRSGRPNIAPVLSKLAIGVLIILGLIAVWLLLLGAFRLLGSIGQYRRGRLGRVSGFFRRLGDLLAIVRRMKPPRIRMPRRRKLRVKVKDRASLASYQFKNPFRDPALRSRLSPAELVRYSYGALMAFAKDAGFPRRDDQTPYEFAMNVPETVPRLVQPTRQLTELFVRAEYAPQTITADDINRLQRFWTAYESTLARVFR